MNPQDLLLTTLNRQCGYKVKVGGKDVLFFRPHPTHQNEWALENHPGMSWPEERARLMLYTVAMHYRTEVTVWQCCFCARKPEAQKALRAFEKQGILISHGVCEEHKTLVNLYHERAIAIQSPAGL